MFPVEPALHIPFNLSAHVSICVCMTYEWCRVGPGPGCAGPERRGQGGGQSSGQASFCVKKLYVYVWTCACVGVHVWSMVPLWPRLHCYRQTSPHTHTHFDLFSARLRARAHAKLPSFTSVRSDRSCFVRTTPFKKGLLCAITTHATKLL